MRKDRVPDKSFLPVDNVTEGQIKLTQAEIADRNGTVVSLDLHGLRPEDAEQEVQRFIEVHVLLESPFLKIIHGKGGGVLAGKVAKILDVMKSNGTINSYSQSSSAPGGALLVLLS